MENEFPGNSRRERKPPVEKETEKIVEAVVTGEVVRRKKPLGKRFLETFIGGDAKSVGQYIFLDVLIPAAKDTIADIVTQGIERTLFGEVRSSSRRNGMRPGGTNGFVNYNSRYSRGSSSYSSPGDRREDPTRPISQRSRAAHDFDEIILATRVEAEEVIGRLFDIVEKYDMASVSDLYALVGVTPEFTDEKWGWTDLRGVGATRVRNGYLLDLPRPEPLK